MQVNVNASAGLGIIANEVFNAGIAGEGDVIQSNESVCV